jgi:hypothetical protein
MFKPQTTMAIPLYLMSDPSKVVLNQLCARLVHHGSLDDTVI